MEIVDGEITSVNPYTGHDLTNEGEDKVYDCIGFDAQYFLMKNFTALQRRQSCTMTAYLNETEGDSSVGYLINKYEFDFQDLVKQFFWSIVKIIRDYYPTKKILLLWDKPPYERTKIIPQYKGDRVHITADDLVEYDINDNPAGYLQLKEDYRAEFIKSQAKYWIINNLGKLGMPSVIQTGFEADDLACIFSKSFNRTSNSAICSIDSDWMFWIDKNIEFIKVPKSGDNYEAWTYEDVEGECEYKNRELNIDLYTLKCFMDSTFYSHNNLPRTTDLGWKEIIKLYTEIEVNKVYDALSDPVQYELNQKSFRYEAFPGYQDAFNSMLDKLANYHDKFFPTMQKFYELQKDGFKVSGSYMSNYIDKLTEYNG